MKNILKRGVTIYMTVLALLLSCFVSVPHTAHAIEWLDDLQMYFRYEGITYYNGFGDARLSIAGFDYQDNNMEHVVIPSVVEGQKVFRIGYEAFLDCTKIKTVQIPNTVSMICEYAFKGCTGLREVIIPPSVTSLGAYIFEGATNLQTVYYPGGITLDRMCDNTSISYIINQDNTISLTVEYVNNESYQTVQVSAPETLLGYPVSSIDVGNHTFFSKDNLTCDKHKVTWNYDENNHWFAACSVCGKTDVKEAHTFENGNTACECGYIPYTYTAAKQDATLDYGYATGATLSVDVKPTLGNEQITYQWFESVNNIDTAIAGATGASYTMPTGKGVGSYTYYCKMDCGGYQVDGEKSTIIIRKKNITVQADSLTKVAGEENPALTYTVPQGTLVAGDTTADWTVNLTTTATKDSPVGEYPITGTITSEKYNVTVTPGVLTVVATEEEKDYVNPEVQVPRKGDKFKDAGNKAVYKVTKAGTIAGGVGTVEYTKPVKKTAKTVTVPSTITVGGIKYKVTSIAKNAFKNNKKITKVTIGKYVKTIGANAFYKCTKLKSVTLGKSVATIGDKVFYKCTALTKITLPSKVAKIGKQAFYGCKKLKTITVKTKKLTSKKMEKQAFKGIHAKATIKVPKSKYKTYKTLFKKAGVGKKGKYKKF